MITLALKSPSQSHSDYIHTFLDSNAHLPLESILTLFLSEFPTYGLLEVDTFNKVFSDMLKSHISSTPVVL